MRLLVLVLVVMMLSGSTLALVMNNNMKTLMAEMAHAGHKEKHLLEGEESDVNNHHYIPRTDFNNYGSSGSGSGSKGGDDGNEIRT